MSRSGYYLQINLSRKRQFLRAEALAFASHYSYVQKSSSIAAAQTKKVLEEEKNQKSSNPHSVKLTASIAQKSSKSEQNKPDTGKKNSP